MSKTPQRYRILRYMLDFGSITRAEAFTELGIVEAPARIVELKKEGYIIITDTVYGKNRYGEPVHWARWSLVEEPA